MYVCMYLPKCNYILAPGLSSLLIIIFVENQADITITCITMATFKKSCTVSFLKSNRSGFRNTDSNKHLGEGGEILRF